jgi:cbb3-type cytochrome oxidase maturation protein
MNSILFLLPIALGIGLLFLILFLLAARSGQFEDLDDPAERILHDDD